jgi:phosphatidylinositol alpha-1,6-mannosyltransferase
VVTNLAKHLEQRGHGVVMLHPGHSERPALRKTIRGFTGYEYNLRTPLIRDRPVRSLIAFLVYLVPTLLRLSSILRYHRIGIVNIHYPVEGFVYFGILRYLLPAKLVISVHGADLFPGGKPRKRVAWSLRFLLRSAHALVAPSEAFLRDCSDRFPAAFKRGVSIHNGIDTEELTAADVLSPGTPAPDPFVLCIAEHNQKKALDVLLKAFVLVSQADRRFKLLLVGDGPLRGELEDQARALSLADQVVFMGRQGRSDTLRLLRQCRMFVLPSRSEPFGMVVVEALLSHRPVVASAVGGIPEIVHDRQSGLLVQPDDPGALAGAIQEILNDEGLGQALAETGYTRAMEIFTSHRMGSDYERLYLDVLGASRPTKSLLISHLYFPPQFGGITRLLERTADAMGPEKLCCLTGVPAVPAMREANGGPRVYRSGTVFSGSTQVARAAAWVRTMSAIMIRERPRAVLLGTVYDGVYGRWLHRWLRLPYVTFAHGNEILGILRDERETGKASVAGEALRRANRVVAVSRYTAGLVQRVGVHPDRIEVVYPGCDSTQFSPRPANPELKRRILGPRYRDRVILTTGNLVDRKGHDMVIRALAILHRETPDVTYLIVGDGPCRSGLAALAASLGVQDRVVFTRRVPDDELPDLYALSDVFIMASREREEECDVEGFGIVYLEAGACGKPVIGGRSGGVPEAILNGVSGLLVDPDSAEGLASALTRVLTDSELASRLGAQGRSRVVRDFTWQRTADRLHEILATAAGRERRTAES